MSGYTTATNVRLHAGVGAGTAVIGYIAKTNSYIVLYEKRNGWYRILPDDAPLVPWVSAQYVRQAPEVELNLATAAYYIPPLNIPPAQMVPQNLPPQESKPFFTGPLRSLFVPWTWSTAIIVLLPFVLGFLARLGFRDFGFPKAGDYAFIVVGSCTLASVLMLGITSQGVIVMATILFVLGVPPALYPLYRLWAYMGVRKPLWTLRFKIRRRIIMDDEKKDKIMKPEVMLSVAKMETTNLERRDETPPSDVNLDIEPKPLSRFPLINTLNRAAYKSQADTIRAVTDLVNAKDELGQAAARLDRLQNVAKRDKQTLTHGIEEEEEKHKTRLLEENARQAKLKAEIAGFNGGGTEQQPGRSRRSVEDELRATVAKETEAETARLKILTEERQKCEEKVRRGEMKREDMEHYLSIIEARLNHHIAGRQ
jgi:hypothetical protein